VHRNEFLRKVAWWWEPPSVREALKIIEEIGEITAFAQLHDIFTDYRHTIHDLGLADSKFRISTKSVTDVYKIVHGIELS
jgi:hypothetical protein